jgi:polygalacturonase
LSGSGALRLQRQQPIFRFLALFFVGVLLKAQDMRQVTEPVLRPVCTALAAHMQRVKEDEPDTQRIQEAIDRCSPGQAVELKADGVNHAFLSGPLNLRSGVALVIDKGVTLFASRNPRDYDITPGSCGILSKAGHGCRALINGDHVDHAAVMGEGTIDGRGGEKIAGKNFSWWDLAEQARNTDKNQNCPRLIVLSHSNDFTLYKVTLRNSPNFHVYFGQGNGFTAWGVIINSPKNARNTDGIDPGSSTNVTITHCFIHAGDDQVAIKAGETGPSTHMTIAHNHFYTGHGISIGSETVGGVRAIRVSDLTIDGADNGIRIKSNSSRGGLVQDVVYEDVCIRDTKNPILMDTHYSFYGSARNLIPEFRDITLRNVTILGGGKITLDGFDAQHLLQMHFDNVIARGAAPSVQARFADIQEGPGPVNFRIPGAHIRTIKARGSAQAGSSSCPFVPMPESR